MRIYRALTPDPTKNSNPKRSLVSKHPWLDTTTRARREAYSVTKSIGANRSCQKMSIYRALTPDPTKNSNPKRSLVSKHPWLDTTTRARREAYSVYKEYRG